MTELPWVEKYRPKILDDIVGNHSAIKQFKVIAENGNIPHMILTGSPGTGKTTSIICLAKLLLGSEYQNSFLELNASDERGIDVIRSKITTFCKKKVTLPSGRHKIIFLDEVDSMTSTAQQALRRIIELHAMSTRFVMACNTSTKIIEAIQSRCSVIRFGRINADDMKIRLEQICEIEKIKHTEEGLDALTLSSGGDMRNAINNLQSVAITYEEINENTVKNIIDKPDNAIIEELLDYCLQNDFNRANEISSNLIQDGYSALDIIQIIFVVIKDKDFDVDIKLNILNEIGQTQMNLIQGGDPYLQLMALISRIIMYKKN
jgi:replication factor C subunit 2/4